MGGRLILGYQKSLPTHANLRLLGFFWVGTLSTSIDNYVLSFGVFSWH